MMEIRVRVDAMSETDIVARLSEIDPSLSIQDVVGAQSTSLRKPQGMEPFTYFVIAFAAHLSAGITHDFIRMQVKKKFADKNVKVETDSAED